MFSAKDREKCEQLCDKYYAGRKFHDALYRDIIRKYLRPGEHLLDAGCGRYLRFCKELAGYARVWGMDLDTVLDTDNRTQPFGVRGDLSRIPFRSNSFDMVISRSVVEHLTDPSAVFREFYRVLRPGGRVVILTPNKWDYVSVIAAATPHWVHQALVSRIFRVPEEDIFPTLYRANTMRSMRKALHGAGLIEKEMQMVNHYPAYLMFSPVLFRLGVAYERITSREALKGLRGLILCVFDKHGATGTAGGGAHPRANGARRAAGKVGVH
jgi:ubiquinone/menaquinone biosynthesis C-methylase UbiE